MKVHLYRLGLPLEHEFTIARGSTTLQRSLVVKLECDGVCGYGESIEDTYYGCTLDSMEQSIDRCREMLENDSVGSPQEFWDQVQGLLAGDTFALSALDQAMYDLHGKLNRHPTYETLGLSWGNLPDSSYTLGMDAIDQMVAKLQERPDWPIYKIKLGTDRDVEIVSQLRQHTDAIFRVDANCGWSVDETISNSQALQDLGVEFIEQPLPASEPMEHHQRVYQESALPIMADESCLVETDIKKCHGRFHGVNVKLCKCGGLTPAARMLREARSLGMKTMIGCMVESSVGISAAAQLLPLLDYADLDGAVLLSDDPASGVVVHDGKIQMPKIDGNGVSMMEDRVGDFSIP